MLLGRIRSTYFLFATRCNTRTAFGCVWLRIEVFGGSRQRVTRRSVAQAAEDTRIAPWFAKSFSCSIGDITIAQIEKLLMELKLASQSYENFRRALGTLFAFAKRRAYLLPDHDEFERVEKVRAENGEIEIFTLDEVAKLLGSADSEFRPCLAISAFAGLRSSEVETLSWEDVKLDQNVIVVQKGKSKTGSRRLAPISENLTTWLTLEKKTSGPLWTSGHQAFYKAQQMAARAAGMAWKQNALRHSFISYRLALVRNEQQVAFESGNSPTMVHRHYKQLVTQADAEKWFAVARNLQVA